MFHEVFQGRDLMDWFWRLMGMSEWPILGKNGPCPGEGRGPERAASWPKESVIIVDFIEGFFHPQAQWNNQN